MPSLTAITCYRKPDLGLVWENIRQKGVQPFQEVVLHSNASRSFKIINPETGLEAQPGVPIVVLEAYEDMYTALFAARDDSKRHEGSTCLFYIGYPGIGKTIFMLYAFVLCCQEQRPLALYWGWQEIYYLPIDDEPQVFEDMHSRTWMKALHPDAIVLCDFNNEIVQPPGPLKYVDRLLVVYASPEAARWRWAEKDINGLAYYVSVPTKTDIAAVAQCVGDPEGRHMLKLSTLIGPSIRHLMRYRKYAEERVTSHFRQMAQDVTSDLLALTATLRNEMVLNAKQAQNFHHFFFMTASSTSASLELPSPKLPHKVGTQWLLRLIRQAICEKQDPIGDNLLTSISSSNSTVFGAAYEAVLLRKVKDGRLYCDYTTPNESGLRLPHVAAESAQDPTRLYTEVYLDQSADLPILRDSSRFFVTVAPNFPTVDAVTVTFTHVQLLQLTVATRHRVQQSGLDGIYQLMERNNLLQGRKWHFIFVAPRKESADALCSSASARKLAAYAHSKLRLNFCFGSMPVPLRRPWNEHSVEVLQDSWEASESAFEEPDVEMGRQP